MAEKGKREQAETLNKIQAKAQEIFFDLEPFEAFDNGSIAQDTTLKLIDELTVIRRNILKKDETTKE